MQNKIERIIKMNKRFNYILFILLLLSFVIPVQAMEINTEVIAVIPPNIASNMIGMRIFKDQAYVMNSNGNYITIDLITGVISNHKLKTDKVLDFDVVIGKIIFIDGNGKLSGYAFPKWPKGTYNDVCKIEACDQGVVLSGGTNAYFIAKNATSTIELPDFPFPLPINNGFLWSLNVGKDKKWEANLHDCFGNLMGKVYKFSEYFEPSDLEVGPEGVDGELLVSATEGTVRTLSLIGNNGRMFWKINTNEKVCRRDVAFGPMGDFFILEKSQDESIILSRWKFSTPEG